MEGRREDYELNELIKKNIISYFAGIVGEEGNIKIDVNKIKDEISELKRIAGDIEKRLIHTTDYHTYERLEEQRAIKSRIIEEKELILSKCDEFKSFVLEPKVAIPILQRIITKEREFLESEKTHIVNEIEFHENEKEKKISEIEEIKKDIEDKKEEILREEQASFEKKILCEKRDRRERLQTDLEKVRLGMKRVLWRKKQQEILGEMGNIFIQEQKLEKQIAEQEKIKIRPITQKIDLLNNQVKILNSEVKTFDDELKKLKASKENVSSKQRQLLENMDVLLQHAVLHK